MSDNIAGGILISCMHLIISACKDAGEFMHEKLQLREHRRILISCLLWKWWNWGNKVNA